MSKGQCESANGNGKVVKTTVSKVPMQSTTIGFQFLFLHTASMLVQGHAPPNGDRSARGAHRTNIGGGSGFARGGLHF